ncbi:MAG: hypothetical protein FJ100_09360 [Deltaproteobacteria bacterium]|nr:hypothetical protein [Deltaproteobacteria bacterium]
MDDRARRAWNAVNAKLGGSPFPLAAALPADTAAADKLALEHAQVLELRRNGTRYAIVTDVRPHFAVPEAEGQAPMHAVFVWTPRCLANAVFDLFDAGGQRVPYAAIAYRAFKPLAWRNQGRGLGLGRVGDTRFSVTQCIGGMVVATHRAPMVDVAELDTALHTLEEVARLAWRGPSPSSFHDLMIDDARPKFPMRWVAVAALAVVALALVAWAYKQSVGGP